MELENSRSHHVNQGFSWKRKKKIIGDCMGFVKLGTNQYNLLQEILKKAVT